MNIFKRELRSNLKAFLIWAGIIFAFMIIEMAGFASYYNNPEMLALFDDMEPWMLEIFQFSGVDLTTLIGFLSVLSSYVFLMLGIHAVLLGSSIISKEERDKTAEYLFTLPITRTKVLIYKISAALFMSFLILLITMISITIGSIPYNINAEFFEFLGLLSISVFFVQLIFLSIGMVLAAVIKRYKKSGSYAVSVLLFTYVLSILSMLSDKLDFLKYFSPFRYFTIKYIVANNSFEIEYIIISIVIIVLCFGGTLYFYPKRDLRI